MCLTPASHAHDFGPLPVPPPPATNPPTQPLFPPGLQQLQLDMFYLRPRLLRLVGASSGAPAEALAQLADEVVAAAAERCTEPVLLEPGTLERLLAAAAREQD